MQIHGLTAAGVSVAMPLVSRNLSNSAFSLARTTISILAGNIVLASLLAVGLFWGSDLIVGLWLGPDQAQLSAGILRWLVIAYWILAANVTGHFVLLGLGMIRYVALCNLAAGLVALVLIWYWLRSDGLIGVAMGRIAYGTVLLANFVPLIAHIIQKGRRTTTAPSLLQP